MNETNYVLNQHIFDAVRFLKENWQKQPVVIRGAFLDFQDPLTPEELAGLAMDSGVDSRLVIQQDEQWNVVHGPFEHFNDLPDQHWSLLVQAVNEHVPIAQDLLRAFRFLPDWRIDDLMVSYSAPRGGVGPHVDQYDVFIIQGQGRRRWQVGEKKALKTRLPHPDLKQTDTFDPIIDALLEPGDMIYIPAGFPHAGTSELPSLNYSVGFRAPSQAELLSAIADHALDKEQLQTRFEDRYEDILNPEGNGLPEFDPWHFAPQHITGFKQLLLNALQDDGLLQDVLAEFLSKNPRPPLPEWPERPVLEASLEYQLAQNQLLFKAVGVRMITTEKNGVIYAVVQGQWFPLDEDAEDLFGILCDMSDCIDTHILSEYLESTAARRLLCGLLNEGLFVLGAEDDDEPLAEEITQ